MKRIFSILLVISIILVAVPTVGYGAEEHISIFVQNGTKGGNGSFELPFGSFNEARDYIRGLKAENEYPSSGVTVYFREGTYFLSESLYLDEKDSGTEGGPVVYRPWNEENVSFIG